MVRRRSGFPFEVRGIPDLCVSFRQSWINGRAGFPGWQENLNPLLTVRHSHGKLQSAAYHNKTQNLNSTMRILLLLSALCLCSCASNSTCATCATCSADAGVKTPSAGSALSMAKKGAAATPQGQAATKAAAAAKKAQ